MFCVCVCLCVNKIGDNILFDYIIKIKKGVQLLLHKYKTQLDNKLITNIKDKGFT